MANRTIIDLETDLVKPYIDNKAIAIEKNLAPAENGTTTVGSYAIGEHFVRGDKLYKAKTAIAAGDTLTLNTNYEAADDITTQIANGAEEVTSLKEDFIEYVNVNGSKNICPFEGTVSRGTSGTSADTMFALDLAVGDKITFVCTQDNAMTSNTRNTLQATLKTDNSVVFRENNTENYHLASGLHILQFTVAIAGTYNFTIWTHTLGTATTYSKFMLCDTDFYNLDPSYQPYSKTNRQLTEDSVDWDDLSKVGAVNLLDNTITTQTQTEATFTIDPDTKIVTVVVDSSTAAPRNVSAPITLKAGSYKLSGCPSGVPESIRVTCYSLTDSQNLATDNGDGAAFTINKTHDCRVYIDLRTGAPAGTYIFKLMVTPVPYNGAYVPYAKTNKELTEDIANKVSMMNRGGWTHSITLSTTTTSGALGVLFHNAGVIPLHTSASNLNIGIPSDGKIVDSLYCKVTGSGLTKTLSFYSDSGFTSNTNVVCALMPIYGDNWTFS